MKPSSAWFANLTDRPQPVGFCVFAPGQVRFLTGGEQNVSRPLLGRAIAKGAIAGPFATEALARSGSPAPESVVTKEPEVPEGWSKATPETLPAAWTAYTGQTVTAPAGEQEPAPADEVPAVVNEEPVAEEPVAEEPAPVAEEPAPVAAAEAKSVFSSDDDDEEEEIVKPAPKKPVSNSKKR